MEGKFIFEIYCLACHELFIPADNNEKLFVTMKTDTREQTGRNDILSSNYMGDE